MHSSVSPGKVHSPSNSNPFPLIYSLDHCGPVTRTVQDAATMLTAMAGYDKHDIASIEHPPEDYRAAMQQVSVASLRVGVPRVPFFDRLEPATAAAVDAALTVIRGLVKSMRDVRCPPLATWTGPPFVPPRLKPCMRTGFAGTPAAIPCRPAAWSKARSRN